MMLPDEATTSQIHDLLFHLGINSNYTGFFHTAYAVRLAMEAPQKLTLVTKWLYPEVAQYYHTSWKAVERNIRAVISIIWDTNPERLAEIAGHPLLKKPGPAQFISIMAAYFAMNNKNKNL